MAAGEPVMPPAGASPLVIGGVGGSGTRLIAQCVQRLGWHIGHDLNAECDNLAFALLFVRPDILAATGEECDALCAIMAKGMTGRGAFTAPEAERARALAERDRTQHPAAWLQERADCLLAPKEPLAPDARWGWKAPNSHVVLDRLIPRFPEMRYVHVIRNGLDMAWSRNQNQLRLWGRHFLGEVPDGTPRQALRFWCVVNRRAIEIGRSLGSRFLLLNFDGFCREPRTGAGILCRFLVQDHDSYGKFSDLVRVPDSIGRFRRYGVQDFDPADVAYVAELGFDTEG